MIAPSADSIFGPRPLTVAEAHAAVDRLERDLAGHSLPLTRAQLWDVEQRAALRDERRRGDVYRQMVFAALALAAATRPRNGEAA
jgi:hypothetical protein